MNKASLCVTIRKGTKKYTLWGIRHVEKKVNFLYVYTMKGGTYSGEVFLVKNAKIVDAFVAIGQINDLDTIATLERLEKA